MDRRDLLKTALGGIALPALPAAAAVATRKSDTPPDFGTEVWRNHPGWWWRKNAAGIVVELSPGFKERTGLDPSDVLGTDGMWTQFDKLELLDMERVVLQSGQPHMRLVVVWFGDRWGVGIIGVFPCPSGLGMWCTPIKLPGYGYRSHQTAAEAEEERKRHQKAEWEKTERAEQAARYQDQVRLSRTCGAHEEGPAGRCYVCGRFIGKNQPRHVNGHGRMMHAKCCCACEWRAEDEAAKA